MRARTRFISLVGAGLVATTIAAVLAATSNDDGSGPLLAAVGADPVSLEVTDVDIAARAVSLTWAGTSDQYRVVAGGDLSRPAQTITTSGASAVLDAPKAADALGRVNYRVEAVEDGKTEVSVEGTVVLPPSVPRKLEVRRAATTSAVVRWKQARYATTYDVAISRNKKKLPEQARRLVTKGTSFSTRGLKPDQTYWMRVRAVGEAGVSEFGKPIKVRTQTAESQFKVGSWNICSESCADYDGRVGGQAAQVHAAGVDIMTLQEAGGVRVGAITKSAFSGGEPGLVPATGGAQSRYIFYRPEKFEQLAGGVWSVGHYGATWARFKDRATERTFFVVDIHLETGKSSKSNSTRGSQLSSILGRLDAANSQDDPVVLAGDFNTGVHRSGDSVGPILISAGYADTVAVAEQTENAQVNTGSRSGDRAIMSGDHVDHVYVSDDWGVPAWKQWANLSGTTYVGPWLSDHNMIGATLALGREKSKSPRATRTSAVPAAQPTATVSPSASDAVPLPSRATPTP